MAKSPEGALDKDGCFPVPGFFWRLSGGPTQVDRSCSGVLHVPCVDLFDDLGREELLPLRLSGFQFHLSVQSCWTVNGSLP